MNEIEEILATASEPLPRIVRASTPVLPSPEMENETMNTTESVLPEENAQPCTRRPDFDTPYQLGDGDNAMEYILRVVATVALLAGICYSLYSAVEVANIGRRFGGNGALGVVIFFTGTVISILIWSALFVLSNISVNARTSKYLLAQIAQNRDAVEL